MALDPLYGKLLRNTLVALFVCAALVALCYFFVDRPVAFFVHDHVASSAAAPFLKALTEPPPIVQTASPFVLALLLVRRAAGPWRRWETALFAACVALVLADQTRESLSFLFGRYWPDTWIHNNPSLIRNDAYGFHPFQSGEAYGSFPSGHTARVVAVASVAWVAWPRWRWLAVVLAMPFVLSLIGMNYHFVGDVVAGSFVGASVGVWTAYLCELPHPRPSPGTPGEGLGVRV